MKPMLVGSQIIIYISASHVYVILCMRDCACMCVRARVRLCMCLRVFVCVRARASNHVRTPATHALTVHAV